MVPASRGATRTGVTTETEGRTFIAVDTETDGLDWYDDHRPFLVTISDASEDALYRLNDEDDVIACAARIHKATDLIFHNAPFDIHMLVASGMFTLDELLAKRIHDTSVLARLLIDPAAVNYAYRLKPLANLLLGEDSSSEEEHLRERMVAHGIMARNAKKYPDGAFLKLWGLEPDIVETYARKDTRLTYDLFFTLVDMMENPPATLAKGRDPEFVREGLERVYHEIEQPITEVTIRMEDRGVSLNRATVVSLTVEASEELARVNDALAEYGAGEDGYRIGSANDVIDMMAAQGMELTLRTEKGSIRTDAGALLPFMDHPMVPLILDWRMYDKYLSTYLHPMQGRDTIHPGLYQIGTKTGRMSSSRPNMQNVPTRHGPKVREALVPRPGYSLVVADYSSIELRVLSYYMASEAFQQLIVEQDFFLWLGEKIFGPEQEVWPITRQSLKNGTYAMFYGGGGPRIAETIGGGMTPAEGRALASDIKRALGNPYYRLTSQAKNTAKKYGHVITLAGRVQHIPWDNKKQVYRDYVALNYLIQGSAADVMKIGMRRAYNAIQEFDAHLLLPIHDELVVECPTEHAEACGVAMSDAMTSALDGFDLKFPLPLGVAVSICHNNYAEAK